ncbi:MAG: PAS domain S-box protein [Planctomycetales bacterium]|nr:PAS domain S-box protein [Planctomycetales bacterium]
MAPEQLLYPRTADTSSSEPDGSDVHTELLSVKKELRGALERENWLRRTIDTANDAFVSTTVMGEVLEWNSKAEQLFGWSRAEVIGKHLSETIFPPSVSDNGAGGLQHLIQVRSEGKRVETKARTLDGDEISVEVSISPMREGSSFVLNAFIHDITSRKQLQAQLTHAQKLESVGQLSAGIAHEINTPTQYVGDNTRFLEESFEEILGVLNCFNELLQAVEGQGDVAAVVAKVKKVSEAADLEYLKKEIQDSIKQSLEGVSRVASIVRAMKEFSHPGSATKTPTDINKNIKNTITVATNEWKYVAKMVTEMDDEMPLIPCLPGDLNQVILNLIVNSAHAIAEALGKNPTEKGTITISTALRDNFAEIRVQDTGAGIPESIRRRIFDPFFTTKGVGVGSGQGLAIARSVIVDKHAGTIDVNSVEGQGTTFLVRLPLEEQSALANEKHDRKKKDSK